MMEIRLAKVYGFCAGVRKAVDIVENALKEQKKLFLIHELVHNEQVTEELAAKGVHTLANTLGLQFKIFFVVKTYFHLAASTKKSHIILHHAQKNCNGNMQYCRKRVQSNFDCTLQIHL